MNQENKISFTVSNIPAKKNHVIDGMIALKKIQHFSYALSDQIGLGYSSHVYKGKNDKTNELVAIKVIDIKKEDELHRQFTNDEVNILQKIKNASPENLLKLQGVFKTKNNLYIITEFCQGKDIAKILRKKKIFSENQAQGILKQFLKGYGELYRLHVVHRDLKLANIFIRKGRVVLADFGFAIDADRCTEKFDYNVGSPFYMPPQSLKFNRYSYKSDVWAIGVIAFQLIYGHRPWKDKDDDVLFDKITNTTIDQLFEPQIEVSENYKQFIRECLKIDYEKRATPQFVINYEWKNALQYIDGLDDNYGHHPKTVSITKLPHNIHPVSTKNVGYKPIQFQDIRENKLIRNNQNLQSPFSLMPAREFSPPKQNLQLKNKSVSDNVIQKVDNKNEANYQYQSLLKKRNQRLNTISHNLKQNLNDQDIQKTIISQIQYCRFLNLVYDEINKTRPDQFVQFNGQLARKVLERIDCLHRLEYEQENELIPGFKVYLMNPRWRNLNQMIEEYQKKYINKFGVVQNKQILTLQSISRLIYNLKNRVRQYERILELLVYLYQVVQMEESKSLVEFSRQSKIEYLAENRNLTHNPGNTERLLKKLEYLGF